MIPKGYTSARVVFNTINKKETGRCTECGKETEWNEKNKRYERLCGSEKCRKSYAKYAETNTGRHRQMQTDPNVAMDMIDKRKYSGSYKFKDGGSVLYNSSYEKEFLMFMDTVMNYKSSDLERRKQLKYTYKGEQHTWNVDYYMPMYNLVIEIKDGGDNPNKVVSKEVRSKQEAKEDMIKKCGKYNYIRLTNKNNSQFIELFVQTILIKNILRFYGH